MGGWGFFLGGGSKKNSDLEGQSGGLNSKPLRSPTVPLRRIPEDLDFGHPALEAQVLSVACLM